MPVSTRSQISDGRDEVRPRMIEPPPASLMGNPHQGLKEKMKALTLYYEQHRTQMAGAGRRSFTFRTEQQDQKQQGVDVGETTGCKMEKAAEEKRPPEPAMRGDPNVMLPTPAARRKGVGMGDTPSCKMERPEEKKEVKRPLEPLMRDNVMPPTPTARRKTVPANLMFSTASDAKENVPEQDAFPAAQEHIVVYTCPRRESTAASVPRKLSMGGGAAALAGAQTEQQRPVMRLARRVTVADTSGVAVATASDVETPADARGNRIMVFVRLRPMSKKEKETGARPCVRIVDKRDVYLTESASDATDYLRLKRLRGRHFSFDAAFPESSSQQQVYATSTAELVEGVLQGRNGSVFCYGATGAGKTYTMLGTVENPGVMVLAIKDLFNKIRQRSHDGNHVVHLSYLEVYNETVRDLLSPGRPLILRQDKQGIVAAGLTQYRAYTTDEVMALLQQGNLNRTTEPTRVNETSSRSHAILQVVAEYSERRDDGAVVGRLGKLSLIDLAGSERALATDQRTLRSLEGANINRSLLALSSCISALVEGKSHVPYRNSKLTQLLKDSLGGACHTVMIANIGPAAPSFGETQNTLHWADRAKQIKTRAPIVNEEMMVQMPESGADQAKLVLELQKENRELRQQLARQQQKLLNLQAQRLAAGSSSSSVVPATPVHPSAAASSPPRSCSIQRRTKRSLQAGNWLATPDAKNSRDVMIAQENQQQRTIKALEADLDRLKKDHILQIRQKDNFIRELIAKRDGGGSKVLPDGLDAAITVEAMGTATAERKRIVTRASLRKAPTDRSAAATELRSPGHRFLSPAPTTKKRSFWDSTVSSSPSVIKAIHDRKTKIHASASKAPASAAPSFLLQPGFTRQRQEQLKKRH